MSGDLVSVAVPLYDAASLMLRIMRVRRTGGDQSYS
jgi:hypothetical protein